MRMAECHPEIKHHARGMCAACYQRWQMEDPVYSAKHRAAVRRNYDQYREEMHDNLGHACTCCGEDEKVFLSLEHIGGGGNAHRLAIGGSKCSTFSALLDARKQGWPKDKFTVLCMNCQRGALQPNGCPHKHQKEVVA